LSLLGSGVDMRGRLLIAWYGPRGLSSLLLILLPVFAGLPGSERLFEVCSLVVLASVVLHGGSPMLLARAARRRASREAAHATAGVEVAREFGPGPALPEDEAEKAQDNSGAKQPVVVSSRGDSPSSLSASDNVAAGSIDPAAAACQLGTGDGDVRVGAQRISLDELKRLWQAREPVTILDVRTERSLEGSEVQAGGAMRMPPDHVAERARELGLKQEAWLIAYCA
jgi:NhaP-type Na+/H+ or K+/H+ antiporter